MRKGFKIKTDFNFGSYENIMVQNYPSLNEINLIPVYEVVYKKNANHFTAGRWQPKGTKQNRKL